MNDQLKQAIEAAGIEAAEAIIAELKSNPKKWTDERIDEWFIGLTDGMELRRHPDRPGVNLWDGVINGERVTLFEQDLKSGTVWCRWRYVWRILEENYSGNYIDNQAKVKLLLEEHLKWRVETTILQIDASISKLEEHLKWRVETTSQILVGQYKRWKNTSNGV